MCEKCIAHPTTNAPGSRRRRIWELPYQCHCPLVGVCFPLTTLRQLINKTVGEKTLADDYDIHVAAVAQCTKRNRFSEILQKDLEHRYAISIHSLKTIKNTPALAQRWTQALNQGDAAALFWAVLTHPRCDHALEEIVLRDMHMLQHQVGATIRADMRQLGELMNENKILGRELGKAQERCSQIITEKISAIEQLQSQLIQQRAKVISQESTIGLLNHKIIQIESELPDISDKDKLRKKIEQLQSRQIELQSQNTKLRQELQQSQRSISSSNATLEAKPIATTPQPRAGLSEIPITVYLQQKNILCVGGRNKNIANYRAVIEEAGGQFAHHDGGLEDSHRALDSSLAAADLVICQTGCISHNSYWRVKDFCKRTGKQCVFVENPSLTSFSRSLQQIQLEPAPEKFP